MRSRPIDHLPRRMRMPRLATPVPASSAGARPAAAHLGDPPTSAMAPLPWSWVEPLLEVVWTADRAGEWTSCSARWAEATGLDASRALGRGWAEAVQPENRDEVLAAFDSAVRAGQPFVLDARVRDATGAWRWRSFRAVPVRTRGELVGWCGSCQDADARRRNEEALRFLVGLDAALGAAHHVEDTAAVLAHAVVPALADACLVDLLDAEGRLRRVAPRELAASPDEHAHHAGVAPPGAGSGAGHGEAAAGGGEAATREHAAVPRGVRLARDPIESAVRRGRPVHVAHVNAAWHAAVARHGGGGGGADDGSAAGVLLRARAALHVPLVAHGRALGVLTLLATSPARRFDAAAHELARDAADRAAVAIDHALRLAAAEQATRAREEFVAVASHELKGPLTALLLTIQRVRQFAQRAVGPGAVGHDSLLGHAIALAERQVRRLAALLDDLFDFARMREGRLELHRAPCDLAALVREIVARIEEDQATSKTPVRVEVPDEPVWGVWDRARIDQVVTNLLGNALKYGRGRPVAVRLTASGDSVTVSVSDQGIGIPPADQARIFDRFERAPGAARQRPGLGLGLYIARTIVEAHGGSIRVASTLGEGSTFSVELPRGGQI